MKAPLKRENSGFSFSYLDVFFLLLLGLVLSIVLYFVLESPAALGQKEEQRVFLSCYLDEAVAESVPTAGETLFDQEGKKIGNIVSVKTVRQGNRVFCKMQCLMLGEGFSERETFTVETKNFICDMWIYSVEKESKS